MVERSHRRLVAGIDEDAVDHGDEVIAGRALHGQLPPKLFFRSQDLLDHDVRVRRASSQPSQVPGRVAKAVDVVDSQSRDGAGLDEVEDQPVAVLEDGFPFDAKPDQGVDGEKAPVVQLLLGAAPVGQPVVLAFQQTIECIGIVLCDLDAVDIHAVSRFGGDREDLVVIAHDKLRALTLQRQRRLTR